MDACVNYHENAS